ncbi:MAG: 3-hydroxyacyl-CoA dehydrogenase NAD-binding domain-containing protein [Gammaproteobacteria bacterium]
MNNPVTVRREDRLALIIVDSPPVNAMSWAVRVGLREAFLACNSDETIGAIVLAAQGREFIAGADIREMREPPREPLLGDLLSLIEDCSKPVVVSLHGSALGGGFETALACHFRCATPDTRVGFPEVKLGLLPGAGGTARMPRLVQPGVALEMMVSGEPLSASRAQELRLFDRMLAPGDWLDGAAVFATELLAAGAAPRRVRDLSIVDAPLLAPDFFQSFRKALPRASRRLEAVERIVQSIEAAVSLPFDAACVRARTLFEACRQSTESASLRHLFFAERGTRALVSEPGAVPDIRHIAVVGAGTMGAGIAASCLMAGFEVTMVDRDASTLSSGAARSGEVLDGAVKRGKLDAAAGAAARERLHPATDLAATATADFVIEAVFESMSVKQDVFRSLDQSCKPGAVLATNTSTLDVDAIAAVTGRAASVLGMHFFSPAHIMRLVEVVRGKQTSATALAVTLAVTKRIGKLGIVVGNGFGFVGNRLLYAYARESQLMMLEGVPPERIDRVLEEWGMAMGPNAVGDLAGLDIGYRVRRERNDAPNDPRYFRIADVLAERGHCGRKTGRGYYLYAKGERRPDPELPALLRSEAQRLGVAQREIGDTEIIERCIYALINEGARTLEEGVASSSADIDVIWVNGYGFPRTRGGPMFHAESVGLSNVLAAIERYAREQGPRYWSASSLLRSLAESNGSFTASSAAA